MAHSHSHDSHGRALFWAITINVVLSFVQFTGGLLSGSLSLQADALHNFSDAGALIIAYMAQRFSGLPANQDMTFGYGRAQILGALINSVTLVVVGLYLLYKIWDRYFDPEEIDGWMVVGVATVALIVDLATVWLTHRGAKENINMKAVFVHNISDALASLVVIVSGTLILLYQIYWVDLIATALISLYILFQSVGLIKSSVKTLMQAVPEDLSRTEVTDELKSVPGVQDVHHVHIWAIHDKFRSLEAHVVVDEMSLAEIEKVKTKLRQILKQKYRIAHSTLEVESIEAGCGKGEK